MMSEKAEKILHIILIILAIFLIGVQVGIYKGLIIEQERVYDYKISN